MGTIIRKPVQARRRALVQIAKFSIRDVYDAIVELVTNADDRYQIHAGSGRIEIEVERHRGKDSTLLRVRDFADGMDSSTMDRKLSWIGGRDSGLADGEDVRGTHSRGAKDVASLGHVTFESIAGDGRYHKCEITPYLEFTLYPSTATTHDLRSAIGIPSGTGTLVTIELEKTQSVPQQSKLAERVQQLVSLRRILQDEKRTVILRDLGKERENILRAPHVEGHERLKQTIDIPKYPGVTAKLIISRSSHPFEREGQRFRLGGILVESKRAVHEATLFDSSLETNPHALWFYGRLICPYIDDLCDEFDESFEQQTVPGDHNPTYVLDPSRKSGLVREHPFVKELFGEALKRLRPLVIEEQRREENQRAKIESAATRRRLNALEKAALRFMEQFEEDAEVARDPDGKNTESRFVERGYALSPPFCQMVVNHSRLFWLTVRQETFPELEIGSNVQIECLTDEIVSTKKYCGLEPHPVRDGVLRALWKVRAIHATPATALRVRVGAITAEAYLEILDSEADIYSDISDLTFKKKRYRIRTNQKSKRVTVLAPLSIAPAAVPIEVSVDSPHFKLAGQMMLRPRKTLGVSVCEFSLKSDGREAHGNLVAKLADRETSATVLSHKPLGADLSIKLEDIDLKNQRYRWRQNVLEIAARHPSLSRYLGRKEDDFPGQDAAHFRVLIAEVVSDAICALAVRRTVQKSPEEYEDADWDLYYSEYSKYMTQFLPVAHQLVCK